MTNGGMTRREALRNTAIAGAGVTGLGSIDDLVSRAVAASPKHGKLSDIDHVVFVVQENRSFDHYFGTYNGVRGFGDHRGRSHFFQKGARMARSSIRSTSRRAAWPTSPTTGRLSTRPGTAGG